MPFYALKEALSAIRRAKLTSFSATATLTIFMFLLGMFLLAYVNMNGLAAKVRERVQIEAFLGDEVDQKGALAVADSIQSLSAVKAVSYVDKEMARDAFCRQFGDEALQVLETNPLPASLKIELGEEHRTFSRAEMVARQIAVLPGVVDVEYGRQWLSRLDRLLAAVGAATLILGLILAASAVLVVATTIRLAFHARREAVEIMRLVGATTGFIARPFVVEGAIYGFLGALLGSILLGVLYGVLSRRLAGLLFLPPGLWVGLLAFGTLLGGVGSAIAMRRVGRK
jgi:cell division transport system permease protein